MSPPLKNILTGVSYDLWIWQMHKADTFIIHIPKYSIFESWKISYSKPAGLILIPSCF